MTNLQNTEFIEYLSQELFGKPSVYIDEYQEMPRCKIVGAINKILQPKNNDITDLIIAYEQGELDTKEVINLFSKLIKNGTAWTFQGHYGRLAKKLI